MTTDSESMRKSKTLTVPLLAASLLLFLISTGAYIPSSSNDFVFNDYYSIIMDNDIKDLSIDGIKHIFSGAIYDNYHPVRKIAYGIIFRIWGLNPKPFHIANILLNSINGILVFFICFQILSNKYSPNKENYEKSQMPAILASGAAALIFILHPVHVESVAYASGMKELLSSVFALLSLSCFIKLRTGGDEKNPSWYFHLSLAFFIVGCLSRPAVILLPVFMLFFDIAFPRAAKRTSVAQRASEYVFFMIAAIVIASLNYALAVKANQIADNISSGYSSTIVTVMKSFAFYVTKTMSPINLNVIYDFSFINNISIITALMSAIAFSAISFTLLRKAPALSLGAVFFTVSISQSLNIPPVISLPSESVLYLPIAGLSISCAFVFIKLISAKSIIPKVSACFLIAAVAACFYSITSSRLPVWANNNSLWKETLITRPHSQIALTGYAEQLHKDGYLDAAHEYITKSLTEDPYYFKTYIELAKLYQDENNVQASLRAVKDGFKHDIYNIELQYYYGVSLYHSGQFASAARILIYIEKANTNYMDNRRFIRTLLRMARKSLSEEEFIKFVEELKVPASIKY